MIIFLHGQDAFRIHERLHVLEDGFRKKFEEGAQHQVVWKLGSELTMDTVQAITRNGGLFSEKQFVVIRDVFSASEDIQKTLATQMQSVSADTIITCTAVELPKKENDLSKALLAAERVEEYAPLSETHIRQWMLQEVGKQGVTAKPEAITYAMQASHSNMWQMHNVLLQASAYTLADKRTEIAVDDVAMFIETPIDDNVFHLTDALVERNAKRALHLLHDQMQAGSQPLYILSMLARQITILIQVKESNGEGLSLHPYVVKKTLPHAQSFSLDRLKMLYEKVIQIDVTYKTSRIDPVVLLERFIIEACA